MAQPIPLNLPPRDPRKELLDRLERAPQEHAEALLDGYELLEQLRQSGILQLLRGTLSAGDEILERVAGAATSPQGTRALRNLLILGQMLSAIDPDLLAAHRDAALAPGERMTPQPQRLRGDQQVLHHQSRLDPVHVHHLPALEVP